MSCITESEKLDLLDAVINIHMAKKMRDEGLDLEPFEYHRTAPSVIFIHCLNQLSNKYPIFFVCDDNDYDLMIYVPDKELYEKVRNMFDDAISSSEEWYPAEYYFEEFENNSFAIVLEGYIAYHYILSFIIDEIENVSGVNK